MNQQVNQVKDDNHEELKKQITMEEEKNPNPVSNRNKMLMILYGKENEGKTSTLVYLALLLAGNGNIDKNLESKVKRLLKYKNSKFEDARFIIECNDKLVLLSTSGDNWAMCRINGEFFQGTYVKLTNVYRLTASDIILLDIDEKNYFASMSADVCVSACRPCGDGFGALKALHNHVELTEKAEETNTGDSYEYQLWLRIKPKVPILTIHQVEKRLKAQAKDLWTIIDRYLNNQDPFDISVPSLSNTNNNHNNP